MLTGSLAAAYVAWLVLAQVNFLYPFWHDLIGIDRTIEVYGPQNRHKQGFEQTTDAERSRLFAAIVDAIHNQGDGLRGLVYHEPSGRSLGKLLRQPEVAHLRDVARLIDKLRVAGLGAAMAAVVLLLAIRRQRLAVPSLSSLLLSVLAPLTGMAVALVLVGPVKVFYWLHTRVFPPGHQWFFYYQDSLMSTMMKAPDLFGCIALAWAMLSLLLLLAFVGLASSHARLSGL